MKTLNLVSLENSDIKYHISKFPDGQQNINFEEFSNWLKRLINYQKINKTLNVF